MFYNMFFIKIWILGSYSKLDNMNLKKELKFYDKCLEASKDLSERHDIEKKEFISKYGQLVYDKLEELGIAQTYIYGLVSETKYTNLYKEQITGITDDIKSIHKANDLDVRSKKASISSVKWTAIGTIVAILALLWQTGLLQRILKELLLFFDKL